MKIRILTTITCLIMLLFACDTMDERSYDVGLEQFYPARVINTKATPGYKKAEVNWEFSTKNAVTAKKVYITIANALGYSDELTINSLDTSCIFDGLAVGSYTFTVQTIDSDGNMSIIDPRGGQTANALVYGDEFGGLRNIAPALLASGAGLCVVDFINGDDAVEKADISYNGTTGQGQGAYYINVPEDGTAVDVSYNDYRYYVNPAGVMGLDAVKVPQASVFSVLSNIAQTDTIIFTDAEMVTLFGKVSYSDWQNETELTIQGPVASFKELYLCHSLTTLTLGAEGSTTSPDVAPINFLVEQGTLTKIIIPDETVYGGIKDKITNQAIISTN